ncbi:hypothetical protein Pelo_15190 [Pelomyxa schiedti]|nr:hypothetical protein Pelo_15190 [Pelomyxa schiedti]
MHREVVHRQQIVLTPLPPQAEPGCPPGRPFIELQFGTGLQAKCKENITGGTHTEGDEPESRVCLTAEVEMTVGEQKLMIGHSVYLNHGSSIAIGSQCICFYWHDECNQIKK